jgi:hypothetical protein
MNTYDIKDMPPRDFIRYFALRITTKPTLQFGLLLSCGDSIEMAMNQALGNNQQLLLEATVELIKLGFMRRNKNEGSHKTDRPELVENKPTVYDPDQSDVEVSGQEKGTRH